MAERQDGTGRAVTVGKRPLITLVDRWSPDNTLLNCHNL